MHAAAAGSDDTRTESRHMPAAPRVIGKVAPPERGRCASEHNIRGPHRWMEEAAKWPCGRGARPGPSPAARELVLVVLLLLEVELEEWWRDDRFFFFWLLSSFFFFLFFLFLNSCGSCRRGSPDDCERIWENEVESARLAHVGLGDLGGRVSRCLRTLGIGHAGPH